jgi:hypothetical protein
VVKGTLAPLLHGPERQAAVVRSQHVVRRGFAAASPGAPGRVRAAAGLAYLDAFDPASATDVAQFSVLTRAVARDALAGLAAELERLKGPDGSELFDVPGAPLPDEDTPAPPGLLPMWDSSLLAYADRARVIPPDYRRLVARTGLAAEAAALAAFLADREPAVYRRYAAGGRPCRAPRSGSSPASPPGRRR